jgi:hypothetical protein
MKSSTQIFAALVATLATFSQSAIAAPTSTFFQNSSIDWQYSSSLVSSPANPFKIADTKNNSLKSLFNDLSSDDLKNRCYVKQIDLNRDGKKEVFIRRVDNLCGGAGRCSISIVKEQGNGYQTILSGMATSPDFAVLSSDNNGWKDVATRSYLGKEFWSIWRFDGKQYQVVSQKDINTISSSKIIKSTPCSKVFSNK